MKRGVVLVLTIVASVFPLWAGYVAHAKELNHDANAAKQLEIIRRNLVNLPEMKYADAKKYYVEALKDLNILVGKCVGTEEALEAKFYTGTIYCEMKNFDEAVKCFDVILRQEGLDIVYKKKSLYFKAKSLLGKGDIVTAKEVVAELRLIEPRAADSFGQELSGMVRIGMEAPTFNVMDFSGKKPIDLSKYKGNVTVVVFWATWCEPCMQEFPKVKKLYSSFKNKDVQFIGISLDDDIEDLRGFVKQEEIEWPQAFDGKRWKGMLPALYHVQAIPTIFVLDRENKVRYIGSDTENISRIVTTLLSESKDVPLFR